MLTKIKETAEFLQKNGIQDTYIGIVLGTGLGGLVNEISIEKSIDYSEIPHFPVSTVESHAGKLIYGTLKGEKVLAMHGRFHYYEGYSMDQITFPIRVMKYLNIKYLLLSNASGAVNLNFKKGTLMLIDDHINLLPESPLRGKNLDEFGPRFPDMSKPYDAKLNNLLKSTAKENNIVLHEGVYAVLPGPQLETRAEYRYLRIIGADVIGMSTAPEVTIANHMGLPCAAVSVITDECDPDNLKPVALEEILRVAGIAEKDLITLFMGVVEKL